jgi:hypothetical protein
MDGDVAPLVEIVELARRFDVRVMVDEAHGLGCLGPGGRGAVAEAGLEDEVDLVVGTLGTALGSYGGFVACDHEMAQHLASTARPLLHSTAAPPAAVAAAMAALELLASSRAGWRSSTRTPRPARGAFARELRRVRLEHPGRADRRRRRAHGAAHLRGGAEPGRLRGSRAPARRARGTARLRLAAMASHTRTELREAAQVLARARCAAASARRRPRRSRRAGWRWRRCARCRARRSGGRSGRRDGAALELGHGSHHALVVRRRAAVGQDERVFEADADAVPAADRRHDTAHVARSSP